MQEELAPQNIKTSFCLDWKQIYNESVVATVFRTLHPKHFGKCLGEMTRVEFALYLRKYHANYIMDDEEVLSIYLTAIEEVVKVKPYNYHLN
jgi:hypothetical protein